MKGFGSSLFLVLIFHVAIHSPEVATQPSPPLLAPPVPSSPRNISQILKNASHFTTLNRLLESTGEADQINTILNGTSNQGLTVFAPTDTAFSNLPAGTLNQLTDPEKIQLVQFHVLPSYVPFSQFQNVSNPVPTEVGGADNGLFQLNVSVSGNQVRVSTGVVDTTVSNAVYSDGQMVIYEVEDVLLPLAMFGVGPAPAPAPNPSNNPTASGSSDNVVDFNKGGDASDAFTAMNYHLGGLPVYSSFMIVVVFVLAF